MTVQMDKALLALQLLIEGASVRSTERITGLHRDTIMRLLVLAGEKCEKLMGRLIVNVPVKDVQADEIWSFIQKKEKQCGPDDDPNFGDAYCFVAIERHSKLVLNFALGKRDQATTDIFIEGLRHATASQNFQITTDGFRPYVSAIENTLSDRVDFAQLIKVYRASVAGEARYSPAEVVSTEVVPVIGDPEPNRICTSHVERQNLTMRMQIRRFLPTSQLGSRHTRHGSENHRSYLDNCGIAGIISLPLMPHPNGGFGSPFSTRHSFQKAYAFVGFNGTRFLSTIGQKVEARQGRTRAGAEAIMFIGHGNVCSACWGYRENCSKTRIGHCVEALDSTL
jgi:IS1 family transposase